MDSMYHSGQRQLQDQFDTRRPADRMQEKIVRDTLNAKQKAIIESADMFFLATADARCLPSCSYRGGDPGFVRVVDDRTITLPNYDGDGMYVSCGNMLENPNVGMLSIDFMKGWRHYIRVCGGGLEPPYCRRGSSAEGVDGVFAFPTSKPRISLRMDARGKLIRSKRALSPKTAGTQDANAMSAFKSVLMS